MADGLTDIQKRTGRTGIDGSSMIELPKQTTNRPLGRTTYIPSPGGTWKIYRQEQGYGCTGGRGCRQGVIQGEGGSEGANIPEPKQGEAKRQRIPYLQEVNGGGGSKFSQGRMRKGGVPTSEIPEGLREALPQRRPLRGWASQETRQSKLSRQQTCKGSSHQKRKVAMFSFTVTMFTETMINAWTRSIQMIRYLSCVGGYIAMTVKVRRGI